MTIQEQYAATEGFKDLKVILGQLLDELAIEMVFNGEDVSGLPHAKNVVDEVFERLDRQFGTKEKPKKVSSSPR